MLTCTRTHTLTHTHTRSHPLTQTDKHKHTHTRQLQRAMNYNTLCLKLSSCLHRSTLTSLSAVPFTFLSASPLYASLPPCLPFRSFSLPFCQILLYSSSPPFILTPSISIYISLSFPFLLSLSAATPPLIYSLCLLLPPPPPLPPSLPPCSISSQTHSPGSPLYCLRRLESHCFL